VSKAGDTVGKAGGNVVEFASKARTPLVAGGAALAGIAGGLAISRARSKNRFDRLGNPSLPKSIKRIDLSKLDLDAVTSAGKRVRSIGEQVGAVAEAAEKANKKHG
jgi:hypothetical protein